MVACPGSKGNDDERKEDEEEEGEEEEVKGKIFGVQAGCMLLPRQDDSLVPRQHATHGNA
jgi:hypothetical protein